jgi:hypothetical protein
MTIPKFLQKIYRLFSIQIKVVDYFGRPLFDTETLNIRVDVTVQARELPHELEVPGRYSAPSVFCHPLRGRLSDGNLAVPSAQVNCQCGRAPSLAPIEGKSR